jgi:hypothetical protein
MITKNINPIFIRIVCSKDVAAAITFMIESFCTSKDK